MKVIKIQWGGNKYLVYADAAMNLIEHDLVTKCARHYIKGFESEDLAQELRLRLWQKLGKYDPNRAGFRTWANMVMNNLLRDFHRRNIMPRRDAMSAVVCNLDFCMETTEDNKQMYSLEHFLKSRTAFKTLDRLTISEIEVISRHFI